MDTMELDRLIESRARGREEANALAQLERAEDARRLQEMLQEHKVLWCEHYRRLAASSLKAAQWDTEWADRLCKDAMARIGEHFAQLSADDKDRLSLDGQDEYHDRMYRAGLDNDPAAFRDALEGWERGASRWNGTETS